MKPLMSFIIPVYNVEDYLNICVNSILKQELNSFEIILIDDGSTDKSSNICDKYNSKYNEIKVIHKKNEGQSTARNLGIKLSSGKYVCFLDSDDYYKNNALKDFEKLLENNNLDMVVGKINMFFEKSGKVVSKTKYKNFDQLKNISGENALNFMINTNQFLVSPYSYMVKKKVLIDNNIWFDEKLRCGEDILFTPKVYFNSKKITSINKFFLMYRKNREGQITNNIKLKDKKSVFEIYDYWIKNIDDYNLSNNTKNNFKRYIGNLYVTSLDNLKLLNFKNTKLRKLYKNYNYLINYSNGKKYILPKIANKYLGFNASVFTTYLLRKLYRLWLYNFYN